MKHKLVIQYDHNQTQSGKCIKIHALSGREEFSIHFDRFRISGDTILLEQSITSGNGYGKGPTEDWEFRIKAILPLSHFGTFEFIY